MRIAVVSDIHGNRTAFEAVLADLRLTAPDIVLHGGDLADSGSSPVEIVDRIRELGWQGVAGNTDEMLFRPASLTEFTSESSPEARPVFAAVAEIAAAVRAVLGNDRLAWLADLPRTQIHPPMALVHASPASLWRAPLQSTSDLELESVYRPLGQPIAVYAHIHHAYVRNISGMVVANTGSVGLPYDGDRRAAYLLLDEAKPVIRRVAYDVDKELRALAACGLPHADWVAKMLESGCYQPP
jgi:predicted phosphodiesterase